MFRSESFASAMSDLTNSRVGKGEKSAHTSPGRSDRMQNSPDQALNFFERQQSDRKKRTFDILSQFNPTLATEVVYKEHKLARNKSTNAIEAARQN